jgi:hypothetical protein
LATVLKISVGTHEKKSQGARPPRLLQAILTKPKWTVVDETEPRFLRQGGEAKGYATPERCLGRTDMEGEANGTSRSPIIPTDGYSMFCNSSVTSNGAQAG